MDTMAIVRFLVAAMLLYAPIVISIKWAIKAGWFWKLQPAQADKFARELFPGTTHFFEVGSHWGFWVSIPLNFVLALAVAESAPRWNSLLLSGVLPTSTILAVLAMRAWAIADNDPNPAKHVLSGFAQNGKLTVPGWCLTFTMALTYTIAVMHFATPGPSDTWFPLFFAIALTIALVVGLLQPPLYVWGKIHSAAWGQSAVFTVLVWALYFAHKRGYVLQ
jgi:hypothetical protein